MHVATHRSRCPTRRGGWMKVYACVTFYASGLKDEPASRWPVGDDFQEEIHSAVMSRSLRRCLLPMCWGYQARRCHRAGRRDAMAQRLWGMEAIATDTLADTYEAAAKNPVTEAFRE